MKPPDDFIFIKESTIFRVIEYKSNNYDLLKWDNHNDWSWSRENISTKEAQKYYDESMNVYVRQIRRDNA